MRCYSLFPTPFSAHMKRESSQISYDRNMLLIFNNEFVMIHKSEFKDLLCLKSNFTKIARLEKLKATPLIDTLFKVLTPMGYKLAIVPGDSD